MSRRIPVIAALALVAVAVQGFRFVTQSGLSGSAGTVQNDGYAMAGGLLIALGGLGLGYLAAKRKRR